MSGVPPSGSRSTRGLQPLTKPVAGLRPLGSRSLTLSSHPQIAGQQAVWRGHRPGQLQGALSMKAPGSIRLGNKIPWGVDSGRLWEQTEVVNPLNPWRRPMSLDHRCEEPTAIRSNVGAIFVSLELSRSTWLITSLSPGSGEKMSKYGILAGDLAALLCAILGAGAEGVRADGKILFNRRHSGGGTGTFLDPSRTAKRGNKELRGRSGLDCDVTPAAASQDR